MRKAFNFYYRYYEVANKLPDKERLAFLDALLKKQFTGEDTPLKGMAEFAYISQRHSIDAQVTGWEFKTKQSLNQSFIDTNLGGSQGGTEGGDLGGSVQEKGEGKDKKINIDYKKLLEFFNKVTGRKHRTITDDAKKRFKQILEVGYTTKDIANAIENCFNNEFHQKNRHFLTLDFISKMVNFQKYVDSEPNKNNVVKLPEDYFKRFLSEEQKKLLTPLELSKWATEIKRKQMEGYTILPILN
jgi:hypothetical protein